MISPDPDPQIKKTPSRDELQCGCQRRPRQAQAAPGQQSYGIDRHRKTQLRRQIIDQSQRTIAQSKIRRHHTHRPPEPHPQQRAQKQQRHSQNSYIKQSNRHKRHLLSTSPPLKAMAARQIICRRVCAVYHPRLLRLLLCHITSKKTILCRRKFIPDSLFFLSTAGHTAKMHPVLPVPSLSVPQSSATHPSESDPVKNLKNF